ncbi:MAG: peptidoglycan-binding domain-containing protein [Candidatus Binatia bacterium]
MALYRRGSMGPEVAKIQARLQQLGLYAGPLDGIFGGGTESAIKAFQRGNRVQVDGRVGPITWEALFGGASIEEPAILSAPLERRCLALTGSFETGQPPPECFAGLTGDFDGQGISLGVCQWNFGQGSLQPLLREIERTHPEIVDAVFQDHAAELRAVLREAHSEQMNWARSKQDVRNNVTEPWRGLFKALCRRAEFQAIQAKYAGDLLVAARALCTEFDVRSQRALALLFDIKVQNGSINVVVKAQIARDFAVLDPSGNPDTDEGARLRIIANRRAEAANPRWVEDVRTRKLTIANGVGKVHGRYYDLQEQYGIGLTAV